MSASRPRIHTSKDQLRGTVDGDKQIAFAFRARYLGDVDVKEANGVLLERFLFGLLALNIGQAADPMPLQTAMQRRARQVGNRLLQSIQAVIQRQ